jgi:DNA polymerase-3 subunit beta
MKFSVSREVLLKPLLLVSGVVEKKQTLPALSNVLMVLKDNILSLTGTDLEIEIVCRVEIQDISEDGEITVPAKKFLDICRSLPEAATISFVLSDEKATVKSGRSRFTLSTLPANDFPSIEPSQNELSFSCEQSEIRRLIDRTSFAMAQQDVRYYLNGMLWELKSDSLRAVSTDGHRLAMCTRPVNIDLEDGVLRQAILPRKGVMELGRLLSDPEHKVEIILGNSHVRASTNAFTFTSKLVDGKFPDYNRVLPRGGDKIIHGSREALKQAFARTSILSNEKYRGVRFVLTTGLITITANNPEQEEAEEQVSVDYSGDALEVGFNVSYLQDVANVIDSEFIQFTLGDNNSSALIEEPENSDSAYVIMPMRL